MKNEQGAMVVVGPRVYAAIANVAADLSVEGIGKGRKNQQQGYQFRGIDDMYNAISGLLAKHGLAIIPRVLTREQVERSTKSGGALFWSFVEVEFDFVSVEDGSKHTAKTFGEAMDTADKSTNKAMSAAYKYVVMQTFCIPTEGDNDADYTTHDVAPVSQKPKAGIGTESQAKKPEPKQEAQATPATEKIEPKSEQAPPPVINLMRADQSAEISKIVSSRNMSKAEVASMVQRIAGKPRSLLTVEDADKIISYLRTPV